MTPIITNKSARTAIAIMKLVNIVIPATFLGSHDGTVSPIAEAKSA